MVVTLEKSKKKPKPKLEKDISKEIMVYLKTVEGGSFDVVTIGMYGVPGMADIIGCYKGQYIAIEVKRPGGKPTALQGRWLSDKAFCGAKCFVVSSAKMVEKIILDIDRRIQ